MNIGIIGGGQLGMMLAEAAKEYGHKVIGLDPNPKCPLSFIADEMVVADYDDAETFELFASKSDVLTYEFENVDLELVSKYSSKIPQKSKGLLKSRNRLVEKNYANELNIPTVKFVKFENNENVFFPSIIKTTTGGYDGKGQSKITQLKDLECFIPESNMEYIVEELVSFDYEISVVATRDVYGNVVTYPIPVNKHRNGILFTSYITGNLPEEITSKAESYTSKIINDLDYVGTLAVEYFVQGNEVIFNEFAPRPHNSGHYTIEGCTVSQFENHILAICGEKVNETKLVSSTIMINVLGQDNIFVERAKEINGVVYMYKKDVSKTNRKMGHITIMDNEVKKLKSSENYIIEE